MWVRATDLVRDAEACQIVTFQAALDVYIRDGVITRRDIVEGFPIRDRMT